MLGFTKYNPIEPISLFGNTLEKEGVEDARKELEDPGVIVDKTWKNQHVPDYNLFLHKMKQSLMNITQTCDWEVQNTRVVEGDYISAKGKQVGGYGVGDPFEEPSFDLAEFEFPSKGAVEITTVMGFRDFPEIAALQGLLRDPNVCRVVTQLVVEGVVEGLRSYGSSCDVEEDVVTVVENETSGGCSVSWNMGEVSLSGKASVEVIPEGFRITVPVVVEIKVDSATIDYDHGFEPPYEYGY